METDFLSLETESLALCATFHKGIPGHLFIHVD